MKPSLRILAVDDHQLFLQGLADCLRSLPEVENVLTCSSLDAMNLVLSKWIPDIIFLDLNLREHDGFSICREIKATHKNVFVAILTQYDISKFVDKAKNSGADAYFIKNTDAEVLAKFIHNFHNGKIRGFYVHMPVTGNPRLEMFKNDFFELTRTLSKREGEVMQLLIKGWDHTKIQETLNVTYDTFKTHRTNILHKLNVKNVAELVLLSMRTHPAGIKQNHDIA